MRCTHEEKSDVGWCQTNVGEAQCNALLATPVVSEMRQIWERDLANTRLLGPAPEGDADVLAVV